MLVNLDITVSLDAVCFFVMCLWYNLTIIFHILPSSLSILLGLLHGFLLQTLVELLNLPVVPLLLLFLLLHDHFEPSFLSILVVFHVSLPLDLVEIIFATSQELRVLEDVLIE